MSFSTLRPVLKQRLEALDGVINVQDRLRYHDQGFNNADFRNLFADPATKEFHAWWFNSLGFTQAQSDDNDQIIKRTHNIEIHGLRGLIDGTASEHQLRDLAESVGNALTWGDRSFDGLLVSHSAPQLSRVNPIKFYDKILAHEAVLSMSAEENVLSPDFQEFPFTPYLAPFDGLTSEAEPLGSALIEWFRPRVAPLELASFRWHPQMKTGPTYPASPREDCPRAFLRVSRIGYVDSSSLSCDTASLAYQLSIWLQFRQEPGSQHQRQLVSAIDLFQTAMLRSKWRFEGLPVPGLIDLKVAPASSTGIVVEEMSHPLGEAALRVSTAQISLVLEGEIGG